jgi:uncharacterized membrane protein YfcA
MTVVLTVTIVVLATFAASAFGFGEALLSVPFLLLFLPSDVVAPLTILVAIVLGGMIVVQDARDVRVRQVAGLLFYSLLGTPLGILLLMLAPEGVVKRFLGVVILLFALHSLFGKRRPVQIGTGWQWAFGVAAGILGGAYGMNGPPVVVYGTLRRWSPTVFRASLQGFFLPAALVIAVGYWFAGLWSPEALWYGLYSLPGCVVAILLGRRLNRRLESDAFHRYVYAGLVLVAAVLIVAPG